MLHRLRYILPVVALLAFGSWVYSDELPKPDIAFAIRNLQSTLSQLQTQMKELQSSMKELARESRESKEAKHTGARGPDAEKAVTASLGGARAPVADSAADAKTSVWQRAQDAYERGRRAEDEKAYGAAIGAFSEAIDLDPKNDSALLHRGYSHYYSADFALAAADIGASIELQPNNSRAYAMRASALAGAGRTSEAVLDATQAIQRDPRNAENHVLRADLYRQLGNSQGAIEDFGQAIQIAPDSIKAYLGRAAILRTHGQMAQSLGDCYKAIQLNPAESAAYVCRAQFYLATGATQSAIEDINRAMLVGQNPAEAATLLAAAQKNIEATPQNRPPDTIPAAVEAHAAPATAPAFGSPAGLSNLPSQVRLQQASLRRPPPQPAVSSPIQAPVLTSVKPPQVLTTPAKHDAIYFYHLGRSLAQEKNFSAAAQALDQAIQLSPTQAQTLNTRCYVRMRLRNFKGALDDCNRAIHLNANYTNAYLNRSAVKKGLGDLAGSREDLRRATQRDDVAYASH